MVNSLTVDQLRFSSIWTLSLANGNGIKMHRRHLRMPWDTTGNDGRLRDNVGEAERKQELSQEN